MIPVISGTSAAYSTDGINWTAATLPSSADWYSVCYGNGKFVAVSTTAKAAYSTDGINWTAATLPSSANWKSVCYGNGKFVAVSSSSSVNKAAYSTDGVNWIETGLPSSAYWSSIAYGNGIFVVTKSGNSFAYAIATPTVVDQLSAAGMARVQVVSYVGTGTYGSSNPCSLTFDFEPKAVVIQGCMNGYDNSTVMIRNATPINLNLSGHLRLNSTGWNGKTFSWYSSSSAEYQANSSGYTYYVLAIG